MAKGNVSLVVDLQKWGASLNAAAGAANSKLGGIAPKSSGLMSIAKGAGIALAGVAAVAGAAYGAYKAIMPLVVAGRKLEDSYVTLKGAVKSLDAEQQKAFSLDRVNEFGAKLTSVFGITQEQTNLITADFLSRGAQTQKQAEELALLAAVVAKKTGKSAQESAKVVMDAANGKVKSLKAVGIEMASTGNKIQDGDNAIKQLAKTYGSVATEFTNPTERLNATFDNFIQILGTKFLPIIEPVLQGIDDFVSGLSSGADAAVSWSEVSTALQTTAEVFGVLFNLSVRVYDFLAGAFKVGINGVMASILNQVQVLLKGLEYAAKAIDAIAGTNYSKSLKEAGDFVKEWRDVSQEQAMVGAKQLGSAFTAESQTQTSLRTTAEAGKKAREEATQETQERLAGVAKDGVGKTRIGAGADADAMAKTTAKATEKAQKEAEQKYKQQANATAKLRTSGLQNKPKLSVQIVSASPQRYRYA